MRRPTIIRIETEDDDLMSMAHEAWERQHDKTMRWGDRGFMVMAVEVNFGSQQYSSQMSMKIDLMEVINLEMAEPQHAEIERQKLLGSDT